MVLSSHPAVVGTVTINPALDRFLTVPQFTAGTLNRAVSARIDLGSKGTHVAVAVCTLGVPSVSTGILAGHTVQVVAGLLAAQGVELDFVWSSEFETRQVYILTHPESPGKETMITEPGSKLSPMLLQELKAKVGQLAARCRVMVFAGGVTPQLEKEFLPDLISTARQAGSRVILDADGEALRTGLVGRPWLVKPTQKELERAFGLELRDDRTLIQVCRRTIAEGVEAIVVSQGEEGAILVTTASAWRLSPPRVAARNTTGCGDAMVGGITAGLCRDLPILEAVRLGVAVGAAKAVLQDTADGSGKSPGIPGGRKD